jgi:hypothetical protein
VALIKSLPNDIICIAGRNFADVLKQDRKLWKPDVLEENREGRTKSTEWNVRRLSVMGEVVLLPSQHPLTILLHRQMRVLGRLIRGLLDFLLQETPLETLLLLVLALL